MGLKVIKDLIKNHYLLYTLLDGEATDPLGSAR
jgi:hypothetical protein